MNFFETYYKQIIKQDLINKFTYKNSKSVLELEKITLNFGCKNFTIQRLAITMLSLEILSFKKSTVTTAKKPNVLLKTRTAIKNGKNKITYYWLIKFIQAVSYKQNSSI